MANSLSRILQFLVMAFLFIVMAVIYPEAALGLIIIFALGALIYGVVLFCDWFDRIPPSKRKDYGKDRASSRKAVRDFWLES